MIFRPGGGIFNPEVARQTDLTPKALVFNPPLIPQLANQRFEEIREDRRVARLEQTVDH